MSDTVISVEKLSKRYIIGHQRDSKDGLRHVIEQAFRNPWQWFKERRVTQERAREEFWALKDVSFEVRQGDVVGIIGRNGAGKSTLLKILSRITEPTKGRIRIKGRVASLLEVGTGFHQELTGRENIYLNGAILGMQRAEIRRKFDEIVAFSEIDQFLDTPVKRYSSGMYVRLAFAVAAHLEPEILVVDEVLAVGDVQFQKKCLGKMEGISSSGRSVLFVSHQIPSVTRLCRKALWLDHGQVRDFGSSENICMRYLSDGSVTGSSWVMRKSERAPGNEWVRLEEVEARSEGAPDGRFEIDKRVQISLKYRVLRGGKVLIPNVHFYGDDGTLIFIAHDWYSGWRERSKPPGLYRTIFSVPGNFFNEGRVLLKAVITTYRPFEVHVDHPDVAAFTIVDVPGDDTARGDYGGHYPGVVRPAIPTTTEILT